MFTILVVARLCEPSNELHVAEHWYRTTALQDLLGVSSEQIYDERLYRTLDRVVVHKEAIEKHFVKRLGELFELDYDLLLYDVTSTYFEAIADAAITERRYSRDHRPDCVQINIALVVTRERMPLDYEIFSGAFNIWRRLSTGSRKLGPYACDFRPWREDRVVAYKAQTY